jgi:hypothetical protein
MPETDYAAAAETLRDAAHLLHVNGWARGKLIDRSTGCMCAWGAIIAAIDPGLLYRIDVQDLRARAATEGLLAYLTADPQPNYFRGWPSDPEPIDAIVYWNDHEAADGEMVEGALRRAAEWCEGRTRA